jgi:hypothetical protein
VTSPAGGGAAAVEALLDETPAWAGVEAGDAEALAEIERRMRRLDTFSPEDVEAGARRYVASRSAGGDAFDVDAMSKVYVLARYLFDVPDAVPGGRPRFASFIGVPVREGVVDELWPWEAGPDGEPDLTGYFRGYAGETYNALGELDAFKERYGFRRRAGAR